MLRLGIDIGGSGIKGALVDVEKGELASERVRIPTPESRLPEDVLPVVNQIVEQFEYTGPVGVGFPAVVVDGVPLSPFTAIGIEEWVGYPVGDKLSKMIGAPVTMVNDADAAGIAEAKFGAGKGKMGVVILVTLGTGVGSAIFSDGQLVYNTELGKLYLRDEKKYAEIKAAERAREEEDLNWEEYAERLQDFLSHVETLFTPKLIIIGGGVSKKSHKYVPLLNLRAPVVPAQMRNQAGIIGAALATL